MIIRQLPAPDLILHPCGNASRASTAVDADSHGVLILRSKIIRVSNACLSPLAAAILAK